MLTLSRTLATQRPSGMLSQQAFLPPRCGGVTRMDTHSSQYYVRWSTGIREEKREGVGWRLKGVNESTRTRTRVYVRAYARNACRGPRESPAIMQTDNPSPECMRVGTKERTRFRDTSEVLVTLPPNDGPGAYTQRRMSAQRRTGVCDCAEARSVAGLSSRCTPQAGVFALGC